MSDEDLELLITLDDPEVAQDEDTFNHLPAENTLEYGLDPPLPAKGQHDQRLETVFDNDPTR